MNEVVKVTGALTNLTHVLLEENVVCGWHDENDHHGDDVDQKADEEPTADEAGPAESLGHHPVMDSNGVERVGGRGRAGGRRGTAK